MGGMITRLMARPPLTGQFQGRNVMQNKKISLWCALLCLSVAVPMLSGCRFTGGPYYKTSSWEFFNPFSSKPKDDYDDSALAQKISEPGNLPKADVTAPRDGYLMNAPETKIASRPADRRGRDSDPLNDLHNAGLASSSTPGGSSNVPSAKPQPADGMFANNANPGSTNQIPQYGTTSPIDPGFGSIGANPTAANQPQNAGTPFNPNMPGAQPQTYPADMTGGNGMYAGLNGGQTPMNSGTTIYGASGQPIPANQPGQVPFAGQPNGMTAQNTGNPQFSFAAANDPMPGGNPAAMSGTPTSVASTQGMGYGGQGTGMNATTGYPTQSGMTQGAAPQGTMMPPQNTAVPGNAYGQPPQTSMPNGQATPDMGYGMTGYGNAPNSGMPNPAATGTNAFPTADPNFGAMQQPTSQMPQQQPTQYPGLNTSGAQPAANGGYQSGFNSFAPTNDDVYRPGAGY